MKLKDLLNEVSFKEYDASAGPDHALVLFKQHIDGGKLITDMSDRTVEGKMSISAGARPKLENLENFPKIITDKLELSDCIHLTSLAGSLMEVKTLSCTRCRELKSLEGIGRKYIKTMQNFFPTTSIERNILGLVLVKDLTRIDTLGYQNDKLEDAFKMIFTEILGDQDILNCKEKMIAAGYKEFAKL